MRKSKLAKYDDVASFKNVIQCEVVSSYPYSIDKKWNNSKFKKKQPIIIELGCGRGEYTVNLAEHNQNANYIGIDIKGTRIWHGAKYALTNSLDNVLFVRMRIEHVAEFFPENSIDEIWVTFPDPIHKKEWKTSHKRLTSAEFMKRYKFILKEDGIVHFKTDDDILYEFTLEILSELNCKILENINDLYNADIKSNAKLCQTAFEKKFSALGRTIKYVKFKF